ncbi:hypothetical protein ACYPKM_04600 [Pseudomonas aeruginosa]
MLERIKRFFGRSSNSAPAKAEPLAREVVYAKESHSIEVRELNGINIITLYGDNYSKVVYPALSDESWSSMSQQRSIRNMEKMLGDKYFSIIEVDNCISAFNIPLNPETRKIYEKLSSIHCCNYSEIDDEALEEIPKMISRILTSGIVVDVKSKLVSSMNEMVLSPQFPEKVSEQNSTTLKKCSKCKKKKPLDSENFRRDKSHKSGFASRCKPCSSTAKKR